MYELDETKLLKRADEIDCMLREARYWGSWMVTAASEYRYIRRKLWELYWIQLPNKYQISIR